MVVIGRPSYRVIGRPSYRVIGRPSYRWLSVLIKTYPPQIPTERTPPPPTHTHIQTQHNTGYIVILQMHLLSPPTTLSRRVNMLILAEFTLGITKIIMDRYHIKVLILDQQ